MRRTKRTWEEISGKAGQVEVIQRDLADVEDL